MKLFTLSKTEPEVENFHSNCSQSWVMYLETPVPIGNGLKDETKITRIRLLVAMNFLTFTVKYFEAKKFACYNLLLVLT